jgi:hypothetical protein
MSVNKEVQTGQEIRKGVQRWVGGGLSTRSRPGWGQRKKDVWRIANNHRTLKTASRIRVVRVRSSTRHFFQNGSVRERYTSLPGHQETMGLI